MIRKPQLGSRLSNESWYVNEAFFENAISKKLLGLFGN